MVGLFRGQNALILDYLLRKSGGSNPNVVRADPTAADQAIFAGTGLTPVGEVQYITDAYSNQQPQTVEGLDLGVMWNLRGTRVGDFSLNLNVSHLIKYYLEMSPGMQELQAARDAGSIPASITLGGRMGDLIDDQGRPEWKWSLSGSWRYQNLTVGGLQPVYLFDVRQQPGQLDRRLLDDRFDPDGEPVRRVSVRPRRPVRHLDPPGRAQSQRRAAASVGGGLSRHRLSAVRPLLVRQLPQDLLTLLDGRRLNLRPPFLQSPIRSFS